jgi:hypothetical protein
MVSLKGVFKASALFVSGFLVGALLVGGLLI